MKRISTPIIITSFTAKQDGSLRGSFTTPELTVEEKVEFMNLQNQQLDAILVPNGVKDAPEFLIDKEVETKTPSQRLRAVIWRTWENNPDGDFQTYYLNKMEKIITHFKQNL